MKSKRKALIAVGTVVITSMIAVGAFAYRNMNYDFFNDKFLY